MITDNDGCQSGGTQALQSFPHYEAVGFSNGEAIPSHNYLKVPGHTQPIQNLVREFSTLIREHGTMIPRPQRRHKPRDAREQAGGIQTVRPVVLQKMTEDTFGRWPRTARRSIYEHPHAVPDESPDFGSRPWRKAALEQGPIQTFRQVAQRVDQGPVQVEEQRFFHGSTLSAPPTLETRISPALKTLCYRRQAGASY